MKRSMLELKETVRKKLEASNVVLWGYQDEAISFYREYKERFHITACVTEQKHHPSFLAVEEEIPIVEWKEYEGNGQDYIVICASPFPLVENQILASGLRIFEEYIDSNLAKAILSDKKIAIIAGACQVAVISDFLKEVKCFTDEYQCFRFLSHRWASRWSQKSICYLKNFCDVYICMKHEEDDIKFFSPEELPENCKIITIPYALLRLYWPQIKAGWKKALNEYFIHHEKPMGHGPFEYGDININRMIREGKTADEIVRELTSDNFYSEEQVQAHIDTVLRILEYEESDCDVKILQYVQKNYLKEMLYRDMAHPSPAIIWEIIRQILDILQIKMSEAEQAQIKENKVIVPTYERHCTEIPVYPSVARHLGELEWWQEDMKYDVTFYNGVKKLTFEEYIRAYYSVCSKYKEIMETW
ncbi:MAG: hypothetical protein J1E65_07575 [Lachnospiraceae bacterium]|nr:hypothetical protein [Lachnospiraceae bacterium]